MAGALRKTTIEIDWKINNKMLQEANNETDSMIKRAGEAEKSYTKTNKAIDGTTSAIKTQNSAVGKATGEVVQFQGKAKHAFDTTTRGAKEAQSNVVHMENAFDKSKKSAVNMGKDTKNALNNAKESTNGLKNKFGELDQGVSNMASKAVRGLNLVKTAVFAIGTGAVVSAGKKVFELASDTNESLNKVEVAFGKNADSVKNWSKTTLDNIGLARGTALDLAATYGDMSTSMGLSTQEADKMSTSMVDLAGDLASFKNIGIDRANTALNGVFTGETEALKSLGIVMTQTNLEQFAMSSGALKAGKDQLSASKNALAREKAQKQLNTAIKEHGKNSLEAREAQLKLTEVEKKSNTQTQASLKSLSQAELVRLRYNYVMNATKNSHHDFANTSDQAANASRVFSESLKELGSNAGQYLLPIFTPAIIKASNFVKKMADIPGTMKKLSAEAGPTIEGAKELIGSIGETLKEDVIPTAKDFALAIGPAALDAGAASLKGIGWTFKTFISPPLREIREFVEKHPEGMKNTAKFAGIGLTAFLGFKVVTGIFTKTKTSVERLIDSIKRIGPTTISAAAQSNVAIGSMNATANTTRFADNLLPDGISRTTPKIAKTPLWRKLTIGTSGEKLASVEGTRAGNNMSLFSKAKIGMKSTGALGKVVGGAGVIGVGLNALDLLSMNKQNAGKKVGKFGGSTGLGVAGAAIGTAIAPGIGTAIGGAIGAFAGSALGKKLGDYLQKEGPGIFEKMKVGWKNLSSFAKEHPILGSTINNTNAFFGTAKKGIAAISQGAKAVWAETKTLFDDPFKVDAAGKGVSKNSAKAMNNYMGLEQELQSNRTEQIISGKAMSEKDYKASVATHNKMSNTLVSATDSKTKASNSDWDKLVKSGVASKEEASAKKSVNNETSTINKNDIKKNAKELTDLEKQRYEDQKRITKNAEDAITAIKEKARKRGVKLTKDEKAEIKKIEDNANTARQVSASVHDKNIKVVQDRQRKEAAIALSKSAKEQKIILGNLEGAKEKMSATSAAKVVKNSAKARDGVVKEANKEFKQTKAILDEKRYVTGEISEKEYRDLIKKAKKKKEGSISEAEKMHQGVVDQAQKQAKGHLKEVDWETGQTLSKWEQFKRGVVEKAVSAKDWVIGAWNNLYSGTRALFSVLVNEAVKIWDSLKSGIFGKINPVLSGVNKVLDALGSKMQIPLLGGGSFSVSQENKLSSSEKSVYRSTQKSGNLAMNYTGSNSASGQIMAGEEGFEIAYDKVSARAHILGANGPEITSVSPGTKILNHADSKKMMAGGLGPGKVLPGFAKGTSSIADFATGALDKVKDVGGKIADGASTAFDWISDPVGKIGSLISKYAKFGGGIVNELGRGAFSKFGKATTDYVKEKVSSLGFGGAGPAGPAGANAQAWAPIIQQAAAAMRVNLSGGELGGIIAQIHRESGGNQGITQSSAVVDVNTLSGNPARGLLQYIPQTFGAYAVKGHGNIFSGYDQLLAFFNNSTWQRDLPYGKRGWGPRGKRRFAKGGRPNVAETVLVGEEGPELFETDSPGTIHTASQTRDLLSNRRGNGEAHYHFDPTINITVQGSNADAKGIASEVKGALYEMFQQWIEQYQTGEVY